MQPFRIALCQVRAFDLQDAEANLENLLRALDEAGEAGARLVGLPECSYPAYYLRDTEVYSRPGVRPFDEVSALFAEKAKRYGYWLAAGMAAPHGSKLTNSAIVFGPDGERRGQYDKSFLWHFDSNWFERGREFPVWDMGFARVGMLICADGRQPEIARSLTVNGAEMILDLTAWVSSGRKMAQLSNPQCEYMMPVRALENGVWVAAADKWGTEAGSIVYAGRSLVIDPSGETRVCAPSDSETVVVFDIQPMAAKPLVPRRPRLYGELAEPRGRLPIESVLEESLVPALENRRVAVVPSNGGFDSVAIAAAFRELRAQDADLVVFGGADGPEGWQVELSTLESVVRQAGGAMVVGVTTTGCSLHQSTVLITSEGSTEHVATHSRGSQLGEVPSPVISTPVGNVGLMCGDEGLVPEVARCLMLNGADLVAWPAFSEPPLADKLVRTRADENRIYVAAAWHDGGMVAGPTGSPLAVVPRGSGAAMTAPVNKALSRLKEMAPGTDVVKDRVPEAYASLVR